MTISTTTSQSRTVGNGSTKTFDIPFTAQQASDVYVVLITNSTLALDVQVLDTDYTVDLDANQITLGTAPASTETLYLASKIELKQTFALGTTSNLGGIQIEEALDWVVLMIQLLQMQIDYCVRLAPTSSSEGLTAFVQDNTNDSAQYVKVDASTGAITLEDA